MKSVRAGLAYFALVFSAGFALGLVRVPILVPNIGERAAELVEAPFMLAAIVLASRWIARRFLSGASEFAHFAAGGLALALMLTVEFAVVMRLRGLTLREYVDGRDPVARAVYVGLLILFAFFPLVQGLVAKRRSSARRSTIS
jgi:hypothetical protein